MAIPSIQVSRFEDAALLQALGHRFIGSEIGPNGRAILNFENPQGAAGQLLLKHEREGVSVNSLVFEQALRWAKDRVFSARRAAGLE